MQNEHESTDIIRIDHLNKTFGDVKAVNDLSFRVKKGELFAFLGVNGAGKSTTISILCGQLSKDSGTVQIKGIDNQRAGEQTKRLIGVVFQDSVLDKPLTVKENLKSRAALYGITGQAFEKRIAGHIGLWRLFKPPGHKIIRRSEKKNRHSEGIAPQTGDPYFR